MIKNIGNSWGVGGGGGVRTDPLERKFLGGRGVQNKKPSVGGVWIFSGTTHCRCVVLSSFTVQVEVLLRDKQALNMLKHTSPKMVLVPIKKGSDENNERKKH